MKQLKLIGIVTLFCVMMILAGCSDEGASDAATPVPPEGSDEAATTGNDPSAGDDADDQTAVAEQPTATPEPTATPAPAKRITICMPNEPVSLYPYRDVSPAATAVRHAIYESLYTTVGYTYQPQALEKIPSLADGDARVDRVMVPEGTIVLDANGDVVQLLEGVVVVNADGNEVTFDGDPIEMEMMSVDFSFKPLVWSDGTPVTADDSVFSFELAAAPDTQEGKGGTSVTASYEATGERSVRWTGVPGLHDQQYQTRVWLPLPRHQLGRQSAAELRTAEQSNRLPLSSGPFVVQSWEPGSMVLAPNPHYYRVSDGLPMLGMITLRFGSVDPAAADDCDVITHEALSTDSLTQLSGWDTVVVPGPIYEQISFGIRPISEIAAVRPEWFSDARVRQAITMCTDRPGMIAELTGGLAEPMHAYVPAAHPLYPDDITVWPYDPAAANALLDEAGFRDYAGDGRRQDVITGFPMTITLGTNNESSLRLRIVETFQANMRDCGIPVEIYSRPAGSWYAEGPLGPVFGRQFDLAEFAWLTRVEPGCGLFLSDNITGPTDIGFGGWNNVNVTGYENPEYDALCGAAMQALPGGEGYDENQTAALRLFSRELPMIPLFTNVKITAVRSGVLNVTPDQSQASELWNIAEWDLELRE